MMVSILVCKTREALCKYFRRYGGHKKQYVNRQTDKGAKILVQKHKNFNFVYEKLNLRKIKYNS